MKNGYRKVLAGLLVCGFILSVGFASAQGNNRLELQNAKITINGQEQSRTYSALLTNFKFMYFYVPGEGLFVISNSQFDRAIQAGKFEDRQLQFAVSGVDFKLTSSKPILGRTSQPLWVYYDPAFVLDVKSTMFGYGDSESAPYDWPKQIGKHP